MPYRWYRRQLFFPGYAFEYLYGGDLSAPGSIVLARPFFDVSSNSSGSELFAFPGLFAGSIRVASESGLQGGEANLLYNLCCSCNERCDPCQPTCGYRLDLISGVRYLELKERVGITENTEVFPGATGTALDGSNIRAFDQFDTRNQFYGGQIGARAEVWRNRLFANVTGKIALGNTHQAVDIEGATRITSAVRAGHRRPR